MSKAARWCALILLGLAAAALLPARGLPAAENHAGAGGGFGKLQVYDRSREIETLLHRQEWAAAEARARAMIADEIKTRETPFAIFVAQLAVAEAGQRRDEDALWHWQVAHAMGWRSDASRYGAAGELLAKNLLRRIDEPPWGVARREGDGGDPFTLARKLSGAAVTLPGSWRSYPRGIRVKVVVDQQGRVREPVAVESTFSALTFAVLETMRDWRFAPAQAGGEPVASFYELHLPEVMPFEQLVDFGSSPLTEPLALLKAARFEKADQQLAKVWAGALQAGRTRPFLGVALTLRALAAAGMGKEDPAICRFQAAQTLEPRLYGADLSAFGAPGALLMHNPWRAPQEDEAEGRVPDPRAEPDGHRVTKPEPISKRPPAFPGYAKQHGIMGEVVVESVLTEAGVLRQVVLQQPGPSAGLDASVLDAICDWRFKPATLDGRPVKVYYTLTVNFEIGHRR